MSSRYLGKCVFIAAAFAVTLLTPLSVISEECVIDPNSDKATLELALQECEKQIQETEKVLQKQQVDRTNTEYEILVIDHEINKALLRIKSSDSIIGNLQSEISTKEEELDTLTDDLENHQALLGGVLRRINEVEQKGLTSFLLSGTTISSFFTFLNEYRSISDTLEDHTRDINNLINHIEVNVTELGEKKTAQGLIRQQQQADANQVKGQRVRKNRVLEHQISLENETKDQISIYEQRSSEIRNRLFDLRGTGAIPFEEALQYAKQAERVTGVRPAFLLGLIKNESDLGKNVGTGSYLVDMHATRDRPIFPYIAKALGVSDPSKLPVSAKPGYGYGGAMGPAQFIPSTWVCYGGFVNVRTNSCAYSGKGSREDFYKGPWRYEEKKDLVRQKARNHRPSNPWNPRDAFFASSLYLSRLGAARDECNAAASYFAGSGWRRGPYPRQARNYCAAVLSNARLFQRDIDYLERR